MVKEVETDQLFASVVGGKADSTPVIALKGPQRRQLGPDRNKRWRREAWRDSHSAVSRPCKYSRCFGVPCWAHWVSAVLVSEACRPRVTMSSTAMVMRWPPVGSVGHRLLG